MTSKFILIVLTLVLSVQVDSEEIKFKFNNENLSGSRSSNEKASELKNIIITSVNNDEKENTQQQQMFVDTDHHHDTETETSNVKKQDEEEQNMLKNQSDKNMTMESLLANLDLDDLLILDPSSSNRTKRQSLAGLNLSGIGTLVSSPPNSVNNGNPNSVESLLASCQLTNLLMYQLLQQKQQQQASQLNPIGLIPVAGAINQNLIIPHETLSTYLSTSTFVTTMTTTGLVTIPLFFGNKPSTTTITRTKTYEMTTSQVKTLTTTIRPTYTQLPASALMSTVDLNPTPATIAEFETSTLITDDEESSSNLKKNRFLESDEPTPTVKTKQTSELSNSGNKRQTIDETANPKTSRNNRGGKRRKNTNTNTNSRPITNIGSDNLHSNIIAAKKNLENNERSRGRGESAQYKILRDNRERQPVTPAPATVIRENTYQNNNPFYEERDRTVAYNRYNPPTENYPTSPPQVSAPARGTNRGRVTYANQQEQQQEQLFYQQQRPVEIQPDPEYIQYPDDYGYYARRLKRGQQRDQREQYSADSEEYPLEREYLLEPSWSGDFSQNFEQVEKCPPVPAELRPKTVTVTSTEIRTITKLVNPSTAVPRGTSRTLPQSNTSTSNSNSNRNEGRSRSRSRSRSTTTTTTTTTTPRSFASSSEDGTAPEIYTGRRFRSRPSRTRNYDYERGRT